MSNIRKPFSYSQVLSAFACLSFSFSLAGQTAPVALPASQPPENVTVLQQRSIAMQEQSVARQRAAAGPSNDRPARHWSFPLDAPEADDSYARAAEVAAAETTANRPDCPPASPLLLESAVQNAAAAISTSRPT